MQKLVNSFLKLFFIVLIFIGVSSNVYSFRYSPPSICQNTKVTTIPESECLALQSFYYSANGDKWTNKLNWNTLSDVNSWYGVTVRNGHVINLKLYNNNLSGTISSQLSNLSRLSIIYLNKNHLKGEVPSSLGSIRSLWILNIRYNNFTFSDIKPTIGDIKTNKRRYLYSFQNKVDTKRIEKFSEMRTLSLEPSIKENIGDSYTWFKDGIQVSDKRVYGKVAFKSDEGIYTYKVTNKYVKLLTLESQPITVKINTRGTPTPLTVCESTYITGISKIECKILKKLYKSTNGDNWKNNTNWNTKTKVNSWYGVKVENGHVVSISLPNNNLSGKVYENIVSLRYIKSLDIRNNNFVFSDLLPVLTNQNFGINILYSPQNKVDENRSITLKSGNNIKIVPLVNINPGDTYTWYKDGVLVSRSRIYSKTNASKSDEGIYTYKIKNFKANRLTLNSANIRVTVSGGINVEYYDISIKRSARSIFNVVVGEKAAAIFNVAITTDSNFETILESIRFKSVNSNANSNLENFKLYYGNDLLSQTNKMNGDYLTFNNINKKVKRTFSNEFTIKSDVVSGAGDNISFFVENANDIRAVGPSSLYIPRFDISSVDNNTLGDNFGNIKIEGENTSPGEITIVEMNPDPNVLKEGANNVVLGKLKVINDGGENLELKEFGLNINLEPGTAIPPYCEEDDLLGSILGTCIDPVKGTGSLSRISLFERVYLYNEATGNSFRLDSGLLGLSLEEIENVLYNDNLNIPLNSEINTFQIRASLRNNIDNFETASIQLSFNNGKISKNGGFYVINTDNNKPVQDMTPSSISFDRIYGVDTTTQQTNINIETADLGNISVERGDKGVKALEFAVSGNNDITVDGITTKITKNGTSFLPATNKEIAKISLYKNSISESNLIDTEIGSQLVNGEVTFNDFPDIHIGSNTSLSFIITLDFVDGIDAVSNSFYNVSATNISIQDKANNDISYTGIINSDRQITVSNIFSNSGEIILTEDDNNQANRRDKTILAGTTSPDVFSVDVRSENESVDIEDVVFTLEGDTNNIKDTIVNASLYLDDVLVETNVNGDIISSSLGGDNTQALFNATTTPNVVGSPGVSQVDRVTIDSVVVSGATYQVTIDGMLYFVTSAGNSGTNLASSLATLINSNNNVSAFASGNTIIITALNSSTSFTSNSSSTTGTGISVNTITRGVVGTGAVAQVSTLTPTGVIEVGDTFTTTINGTVISYVATFSDVSNVTSGLSAAIYNSSQKGNVSSFNNGSNLTITSKIPGKAFTISSSATNVGGNGNATISFSNMTNLVIPETTSELRLVLNTASIGFQKVGKTINDIFVTKVELKNLTGDSSGKNVNDRSLAGITSRDIIIAPALINPIVATSLNSSATPEIKLSADLGDNTNDSSNITSNIEVQTIKFTTLGSISSSNLTYKLVNLDDTSDIITGVIGGEFVKFNLSDFSNIGNKTLSNGIDETFQISIEGTTNGDSVSLKLLQDGVTYNVTGNAGANGLEINMDGDLDLGNRNY